MINQIEIASRSRQNVTHTLFLDEKGKAVGCTCEYRQYHPWTPCPHMTEWNVDVQAAKDAERTAYLYYELALGI
jgi:hypothetical protein